MVISFRLGSEITIAAGSWKEMRDGWECPVRHSQAIHSFGGVVLSRFPDKRATVIT